MFQKGVIYRRTEIHKRFKGNDSAGISCPADFPLVLIFTSPRGKDEHKYQNQWLPNGHYQLAGQGKKGDQEFIGANKRLRDHIEQRRDVFLFILSRKAYYECKGQFLYHSSRREDVELENGSIRSTILFDLMPIEFFKPENEMNIVEESLPFLLDPDRSSREAPQYRELMRKLRSRKEWVKHYVLLRANGICEACLQNAPFQRLDGTPFLEVHHIHRLADGGPDVPEMVAGVCPNCHRQAHHGHNAVDFNNQLMQSVKRKEIQLGFL